MTYKRQDKNQDSNINKKLNFENQNEQELNENEDKSNVNYKLIYDSIKKTNYYLKLIEIIRVILMVLLSLIIYYDNILDFKPKDKKTGFIVTFGLIEITLYLLSVKTKTRKDVRNNFFKKRMK